MGRKFVECQDLQHDEACSTKLTAANDEELMELVVKHAINAHGLANTTTFRTMASSHFKEENRPG